MKVLSPQTVPVEIFLNPSYVIARFMESKIAYKTVQNPKMFFTLKRIKEKNIEEETQIHIRFNGTDTWNNNKTETLDIDIYISMTEMKKIIPLLSENEQKKLFEEKP